MTKLNDDISIFRYEYFFLSNFFPCVVEYDGLAYSSSEAAFQAQKSTDPEVKQQFVGKTPGAAKFLGKRIKLREDWEDVKLGIMEEIVRAKFTQNDFLKDKLIATGDRKLIETNKWNDKFWGVSRVTGEGENHLGKILMKIRNEFKE